MLPVSLHDASTKKALKVNGEGELQVSVHQHPPVDEAIMAQPIIQSFTTNGKAGGVSDMLVNGSVNNVDFYIQAVPNYDIYIKTISLVIADAGATLNKFGNLAALTNGLVLEHATNDLGLTVINDSLKSNYDFVRLAQGNPAFGDGTAAFRASNIIGSSEGYIPTIDFEIIFGMIWGLRLRKASEDKIIFRVRDDVSSMDRFDAVGYGIKI